MGKQAEHSRLRSFGNGRKCRLRKRVVTINVMAGVPYCVFSGPVESTTGELVSPDGSRFEPGSPGSFRIMCLLGNSVNGGEHV